MRGLRLGRLAITLGIAAFMALVGGVVIAAAGLIPSAIAAPAAATTQCEPLPAAATPTPTSTPSSSSSPSSSPSASASGAQPQLCVGVQVSEATIAPGNTATWTIGVSAQSGTVPGVTVTLATNPAGLAGTFTSSCPNGSGTATCTLGDLATSVTPASYQLEAEVGIPATTSAGTLTLTATAGAASTPAMTVDPAAGQSVTITAPSPSPTPATTASAAATATAAATPSPATQTTTIPPATYTGPVLGALPAPDPIGSTVTDPAGSIASILPVVSPQVVESTAAAANVQGLPAPSTSAAQAGTFAVTIGMSGQTAEILGVVILALVVILMSTKATANHFARSRYPAVAVMPVKASRRGPRRPRSPGSRFARINRLGFRLRRSGRHVAPEDSWLSQLRAERRALPPPPPSSDAGPTEAYPGEIEREGESSPSSFTTVTDTDDDGLPQHEPHAVQADQLAAEDTAGETTEVIDAVADPGPAERDEAENANAKGDVAEGAEAESTEGTVS
jgi:hypothetical protein